SLDTGAGRGEVTARAPSLREREGEPRSCDVGHERGHLFETARARRDALPLPSDSVPRAVGGGAEGGAMSGRHRLRRLLVACAVALAGMLAVPWLPAAEAAVLVSIDVTPSPANVPIGVT